MNLEAFAIAAAALVALLAFSGPASADSFVAPAGGGYVIPLNQTNDSLGLTTGLPGSVKIAVPAGAYLVYDDEFNDTGFLVQESNGLLDQGVLSYLGTDTPSESGVQLHDVCLGLAADADPSAWQTAYDAPVFGYVPWQKDAVGFGDNAADWTAYWAAAIHVDLTKVKDLPKKCAQLGGTFVPRDTVLAGPFQLPVPEVDVPPVASAPASSGSSSPASLAAPDAGSIDGSLSPFGSVLAGPLPLSTPAVSIPLA